LSAPDTAWRDVENDGGRRGSGEGGICGSDIRGLYERRPVE
jgi:hypothetical protein